VEIHPCLHFVAQLEHRRKLGGRLAARSLGRADARRERALPCPELLRRRERAASGGVEPRARVAEQRLALPAGGGRTDYTDEI
jgi:hypothetical protein